jgi:NADPH-dependent 2,4-dienoyl-CoA reductase/sulfur reductase-like enzyme
MSGLRRVAVVGGGVAAMRCALELRAQGFDGTVTLVAREDTPPYDRTLVSKELLGPDAVPDDVLLLNPHAAYADVDIDLRLGTAATSVDLAGSRVELDAGAPVRFDALVLATGGAAVRPPALMADGVVVLRDRADAARLRDRLDGAQCVAIVGGGFIGTEVASAVSDRGREALLVMPEVAPLAEALGPAVGARVAALHRERGVQLVTGSPVAAVRRAGAGHRIELSDGRRLAADLVVVAVGMRPDAAWLAGSPLGDAGVAIDRRCRTAVPSVFAAGDCALAYDPVLGNHAAGHWDVAARQGMLAARTMLGRPEERPRASYVWSDQLGVKLQLIGRSAPADAVEIEDLDAPGTFVARYRRAGRLIGAFAVGAPRAIAAARRELERPREAAPTWA